MNVKLIHTILMLFETIQICTLPINKMLHYWIRLTKLIMSVRSDVIMQEVHLLDNI